MSLVNFGGSRRRGRTVHNRKFIMEIYVVYEIISDNFYLDQNIMIKSEISVSNLYKSLNFSNLKFFGDCWGENDKSSKVPHHWRLLTTDASSPLTPPHHWPPPRRGAPKPPPGRCLPGTCNGPVPRWRQSRTRASCCLGQGDAFLVKCRLTGEKPPDKSPPVKS